MRITPTALIKNTSLLCFVAGLGAATAACAATEPLVLRATQPDSEISDSSSEPYCMQIPEESLGFGGIQAKNVGEWSGLHKWQFMTNTGYLAVGRDQSGPAYIRQKLAPTSKGSIHVVGKGVLAPSRTYSLSQAFYLEPGFDWGGKNEGGKLGFGLGGGTTPTGGMLNQDGFSARLMWRGNKDGTARLAVYAYSSDRTQNLPYGDDYPLQDFQIPVGEWFTITMEVTANSNTGASDGRIKVWADDELKLQRENIHWQARGTVPVINHLMYATFHGGNSLQWAPAQAVYARFGNVCWHPTAYTPPIVSQEDLIQEGVIQNEIVQKKIVQQEVIQKPVVQEEAAQKPVVQEEAVQKLVVQQAAVQRASSLRSKDGKTRRQRVKRRHRRSHR